MAGGRFKELLKKYGKVAHGVHFPISVASIGGLYFVAKSNIAVQSVFNMFGISSKGENRAVQDSNVEWLPELEVINADGSAVEVKKQNQTAELAPTSGRSLALALRLNRGLFPVAFSPDEANY